MGDEGGAVERANAAENPAGEPPVLHPETPEVRYLAERVLGKGVHPAALDRLFQLMPEAVVSVKHGESRHDGVDLRITTVRIEDGTDAGRRVVECWARCRLDHDNFSRRKGIDLAFRRALKRVKQADPDEGRG